MLAHPACAISGFTSTGDVVGGASVWKVCDRDFRTFGDVGESYYCDALLLVNQCTLEFTVRGAAIVDKASVVTVEFAVDNVARLEL